MCAQQREVDPSRPTHWQLQCIWLFVMCVFWFPSYTYSLFISDEIHVITSEVIYDS